MMFITIFITLILFALVTYLIATYIQSAILLVAIVLIASLIFMVIGSNITWSDIFKNVPENEYDRLQERVYGDKKKKK